MSKRSLTEVNSTQSKNDSFPELIMGVGTHLLSLYSQFYQQKYDVGMVEWRVMTILARHPNKKSKDICVELQADKAAISRALAKLYRKRLTNQKEDEWNKRSNKWELTPAGLALHDVIVRATNKLNLEIFVDIPEDQLWAMSEVIQQLNKNMHTLRVSGKFCEC